MSELNRDFLWGIASDACQGEGAWNEGGKGPSLHDVLTPGSKGVVRKATYRNILTNETGAESIHFDPEGRNLVLPDNCVLDVLDNVYYPSHEATDFYHHYKEDISLMAEMGLKLYRTSFNWARVFPNGDDEFPNEEGLKFYDDVLDELLRNGIEPMITLYHMDIPLNVINKYGGWKNKEVIDMFVRYAKILIERYKDKVRYWLAFNEINCDEMMPFYYLGLVNNSRNDIFNGIHNHFVAAAKIKEFVKEINRKYDKQIMLGQMIAGDPIYYYTCDPKDILHVISYKHRYFDFYSDVQLLGEYPRSIKRFFESEGITIDASEEELELIRNNTLDYIGFSCYGGITLTSDPKKAEATGGNIFSGVKNPYLTYTDWGWANDPTCLRIALNQLYDHYHKPLFIVENGLGTYDKISEDGKIHDDYRIEYLKSTFQGIKDAINVDGVDVRGYTLWGGIDIVSAETGQMSKRYGLVYVDKDNEGNGSLDRCRKDSFFWMKDYIKSNN